MFIAVVPDFIFCQEGFHRYGLRENYMKALVDAGGLPVVVPYGDSMEGYLEKSVGLMIIGGGHSIDPQMFGQPYANPLPLKPERTEAELSFFHKAFARKMPILGICGGAQLINVALGGSLIQYLPETHPQGDVHRHCDPLYHAHPVSLEEGSLLSSIAQGSMTFHVNSSHVQAIDRLGKGVRVNARSPDGIVEGIEVEEYPFCLGVQWHPEYHAQPQIDPLIFSSFVNHGRRYACSL